MPLGVPGEIYVGGAGVARGYLGRPELTAERFVPDPFAREPGARLYRWATSRAGLPDGELEYLGRIDHQVKIRGFRIELGEIEAALASHPAVRESVVVATEAGPGGHRQLVAYVVAAPEPSGRNPELSWAELRSWLSDRVPDYLVPASFVSLDRLPLTPNGKVARAALPAAHPTRLDESGPVAPRNDTEQILAEVWAQVLGLDIVGITDNFFALGGDSILTIQVISRAGRRGVSLRPAHMFEHQTIAELTQVAVGDAGAAIEAEQGDVAGELPATPVQAWFHSLVLPHPAQWNLSVLLVVRQPQWLECLDRALTALVDHHDGLRLRMWVDDRGQWRGSVQPRSEHARVVVTELDLTATDGRQVGVRIDELAEQVQAGLDLARGPLLRAAVCRTPPGEPDRVLLVAHHLVVDAVSWQILIEDLVTACRQLTEGAAVQLPPKTADVTRWGWRLAEQAQSDQVADEARWWLTRCPAQVPALPVDSEAQGDQDVPNVEADVDVVMTTVDESITRQLLAGANQAYRTRTRSWCSPRWPRRWRGGRRRRGCSLMSRATAATRSTGWMSPVPWDGSPRSLRSGSTCPVWTRAAARLRSSGR